MQDLIASSVNRVVFGLGVTGLSCARYLYRRGLSFTVVDTRPEPPGLAQLQQEMPGVPVFTGMVPVEVVLEAEQLIVSPGVALEDELVQRAAAAGAELLGDIDLFMQEAAAPVVGITGSNAKSTVTALVGAMAERAGVDAGVGGNLGTPALDLLDPDRELYVLELSSFQLERAGQLGLTVATVLNISPDHLDRHGSMPRYHQAKHRIFLGCRKAVVNRDDPLTVPLVDESVQIISWRLGEPELNGFGLRSVAGRDYLSFGFDTLMPVDELGLVGRHNLGNALAALALGSAVELPMAAMLEALREFHGLPHRCELVAEIDGVRWVNDSKGTNTGATEAALSGLGGGRNIVLIAGGVAKGADFACLRAVVEQHCRALLLIGEASAEMARCFDGLVPLEQLPGLDVAVARAAQLARRGDTVLLSPACASFDMFGNYRERGERFAALVRQLPGAGQ